jgi:hypothetical protein
MKRAKTGRPRIENRARTIEARKPWLKLEMSRRTWYRRPSRKEKRPGVIPAFVRRSMSAPHRDKLNSKASANEAQPYAGHDLVSTLELLRGLILLIQQ